MTTNKIILMSAMTLIAIVCLSSVFWMGPSKHKEPVTEFMAVGRVSATDYTAGQDATKISFEHPDGQMERMVFCKGGNVELIAGSRYAVTWAIWYTGTPGEGCYTLNKVQRIYAMEESENSE